MRASQIATAVLALSPAASAFALWPSWSSDSHAIVARDDSKSSASPSPVATSAASKQTQASKTNSGDPASQTDLNTGGDDKSDSNSTASATATVSVNPQDPAGNVVMTTPATTLGVQLWRIGDPVTLGWNYTNLQVTPTAIDVMISCSSASYTWAVSQNMSFTTAATVTWDTGAYQSTAVASPLNNNDYTLLVFEAGSGPSATAEAGHLAPFSGFKFGLYLSQPYTNTPDTACVTCSGAMSDSERRIVGVAIVTSLVTVMSFSWFVFGFRGLL